MALHSYILHNGRIVEAGKPELFAGQIGLLAGWGVFTTLRIADGIPFAWDRHWSRMSRDAKLLNVGMPANDVDVKRDLNRLIEANGHRDCTLRLVIVRNLGGLWEGPTEEKRASDVIALTADSKAWGTSVRLGIQPNARFAANEFAGAKMLSWAANLRWAERAVAEGFDEVVLLNEHGRVTECTSANIFAVKGGEALTPPVSEGCLAGITREILLEQEGVRESTLSLEDLYGADEVFITSTTRDLLPVAEIAGRKLNRGAGVRDRLSSVFRAFLERQIADSKPIPCP